ncbi:Na(+)-translocating NADH-quinone reductase subunit B [hydrothermal vent metagenome]|uniref:Na(+)-translocating NADH-quinone reductase subunit B n=1 Tax=hydrothermal vent metagenome TaxID=652676 RepID=A0A3B0XQ04_9ZZZZ
MRLLRNFLDRVEPHFLKGGRYEQFGALYEALDTFLYSPKDVTHNSPHVRDAIDLKRVMMTVYFAVLPCFVLGMYNIGHDANTLMLANDIASAPGWRGVVLNFLGSSYDPESILACLLHGGMYVLPIYMVTFVVGITWEVIFATVRNHEVNEGFFVTSILFTLILPATIPLWQVALGITFGVVIGKEIFGGVGKNFLNPALVGRAFLFFAYPAQMSGDSIWIVVDAVSSATVDALSGATPLALWNGGGLEALQTAGVSWESAFLGFIPGSIGETSALACLFGAAMLVYTRIASWRIMAGVLAGMVGVTLLFNGLGSDTNSMFSMPWYWHLVLGGYAFGLVFMATDPVSASMTETGKWVFGILIGVMVSLIRVTNPAYPEGMMLAILFANVFAPLIDWFVVQANVRRRLRRNV